MGQIFIYCIFQQWNQIQGSDGSGSKPDLSLSPFQAQKLNVEIQEINPGCCIVRARPITRYNKYG